MPSPIKAVHLFTRTPRGPMFITFDHHPPDSRAWTAHDYLSPSPSSVKRLVRLLNRLGGRIVLYPDGWAWRPK